MMSLIVNTKINPGFENLKDDQSYTFLSGMISGRAYCYFASTYEGDTAVVHCIFKNFKLSTFKAAILDFKEIKKIFKYDGIKKIIAVNDIDSGPKWDRFLKIFGFGQPETIRISRMEV